MQQRHTYRNLNFFSYDDKATAIGAEAGERTLEDWNRNLRYREKCKYSINGVNLFELRQIKTQKEGREVIEPKFFESVAELKQFFKEHIFNNMPEQSVERPRRRRVGPKVPTEAMSPEALAKRKARKSKPKVHKVTSEERANMAAEQACLQWQQSGIQHATYYHALGIIKSQHPQIDIPMPDFKINFQSVPGGAIITEENIIKKWVVKDPFEEHKRSEKDPYYAKTQTTYLFTPETIQVQDLVIDCPSKALAPVFDQRPPAEQGTRVSNSFLRSLYSFVASFSSKPAAATTEDIPSVPVEDVNKITIKLK